MPKPKKAPATRARSPQRPILMLNSPTGRKVANQPAYRVEWVHRDTLTANSYNPNHVAPPELKLLKRSILADGWTQPIVARRDNEIVDGFHRWTLSEDPKIYALTDGYVPVVRLREGLSLIDQMAATVRHNRARGVHGIVAMAELTREIVKRGGDPTAELGMEDEEVERMVDLTGVAERQEGEEFSEAWNVQQ